MKNFAMVFTLFFCSLMLFLSVSLNISDDSASISQSPSLNDECLAGRSYDGTSKLTVAASLMACGSSVFDPADLQQLKDTNECVDCNLKGADLGYADLGETDLRGADLRGADLNGAYLRSANLSGADLGEADLRGAYLNGAYLNGANLNGSVLRYATVTGVTLCNTIMPDGSVINSGC